MVLETQDESRSNYERTERVQLRGINNNLTNNRIILWRCYSDSDKHNMTGAI